LLIHQLSIFLYYRILQVEASVGLIWKDNTIRPP